MDEMYLYDDYIDDTMSVKSNKIVKPLKGGMQFHWLVWVYFYLELGIINFSISIERILLNMRRTARKLGKERTLKLIEEQREK